MNPPKQKSVRGRPKVPWDRFDEELWRRLNAGEAAETVQAEARYLADWAKSKGISTVPGNPAGALKLEQIRQRIKKRYNGSEGYISTRLYLMPLPDQNQG